MASGTEAGRAEHDVEKQKQKLKNKQHTGPQKELRSSWTTFWWTKKHHCQSRDAEANDMTHMGSDHRCVMARFVIPAKTKKKPLLNGTTPKRTLGRTGCDERVERYRRRKQSMDSKQDTKTLSRRSKKQNRRQQAKQAKRRKTRQQQKRQQQTEQAK